MTPPPDLHNLLARQLRRAQVEAGGADEAVRKLLDTVNQAYQDFDSSRRMLERSLDLSSQELMQANAELRQLLAARSAAEKQMEALHAQRLEATGLLAGGVAHDFNNLLTVIKGSCDVLLKLTEPNDVRTEVVRQVEATVARAATLTKHLLAFSRRQVLEPRIIDLNQTVAGLADICRPMVGDEIELRWKLEPELPLVSADPAQVEQVIVNLVLNARDAMPSGGTLELQTARASESELLAHAQAPARLVRLSVKDSGAGMSADVKSRIFEPFFTTKAPGKGTGLGLSTVYGIVRQSGGFLTVESEVARGTTFNVFLPESEPGADAPTRSLSSPQTR